MQSILKSKPSATAWGICTLTVVVIISLTVAWVYVNPPKQQLITFYTDDAISITRGDTVRVAGIIVGKVKDLSVEPDQIRVRAGIDKDVFVGDQSQIEVRMLTVVGGYFVTIISLGDEPLGSRPVPKERVTMPYSLMRTLVDTTRISDNIASEPIRKSIDQVQEGLTGDNTAVVTKLIEAGNAITDTLDHQRGQLTAILDISNEYIRQLNNSRDLLEYMISRVAILEETLVLYGKGFATALEGLGQVVERLESVTEFYMNHRNDFLERTRGILGEFQALADRNGVTVRVLRRIRERMEHTLAAQNFSTPPELFATDLCIPVEASRC